MIVRHNNKWIGMVDYIAYQEQCLKSLNDCRKGSENDFEDKISYITAGALGISLTLFKDYGGCDSVWMLLISWWMLLASLLINCLSAHYVRTSCVNTAKKVKNAMANGWSTNFNNQIERINNISDWCNRTTIVLSMAGIMAIVLFTTLNFSNMATEKQPDKTRLNTNWDDNSTARDRTVKIQGSRGVDTPVYPSEYSGNNSDGDSKGNGENGKKK